MKFNGELWMKIPVTQKQKGEPDEFVVVKNPKSAGGLIPYARYGDDWTTTVPNRVLIRELLLLSEKGNFAAIDRDMFERLFEAEKEARKIDLENYDFEIKRLKDASETDLRHIRQVSDENLELVTKVRTLERTLDNYLRQ